MSNRYHILEDNNLDIVLDQLEERLAEDNILDTVILKRVNPGKLLDGIASGLNMSSANVHEVLKKLITLNNVYIDNSAVSNNDAVNVEWNYLMTMVLMCKLIDCWIEDQDVSFNTSSLILKFEDAGIMLFDGISYTVNKTARHDKMKIYVWPNNPSPLWKGGYITVNVPYGQVPYDISDLSKHAYIVYDRARAKTR